MISMHACNLRPPLSFTEEIFCHAVNSLHFFLRHRRERKNMKKMLFPKISLAHAKHANLIKFHSRNVSTALEAASEMTR